MPISLFFPHLKFLPSLLTPAGLGYLELWELLAPLGVPQGPDGRLPGAVERIVQAAPIFPLGQPQAASICLKRRALGDCELGVRRQISSEGEPVETMAVLGYLPALLHSS